jgi:phage-related protein
MNDHRLIFETAVDKFKEGITGDIPEELAEKSNYRVEVLHRHGEKSITDSLDEIRSSLEKDEAKNIEEAKKKINELKKSTVRVD